MDTLTDVLLKCSYAVTLKLNLQNQNQKYEILIFSQGYTLVQRLNIDFVNVLLNIFKVIFKVKVLTVFNKETHYLIQPVGGLPVQKNSNKNKRFLVEKPTGRRTTNIPSTQWSIYIYSVCLKSANSAAILFTMKKSVSSTAPPDRIPSGN